MILEISNFYLSNHRCQGANPARASYMGTAKNLKNTAFLVPKSWQSSGGDKKVRFEASFCLKNLDSKGRFLLIFPDFWSKTDGTTMQMRVTHPSFTSGSLIPSHKFGQMDAGRLRKIYVEKTALVE